MNKIKRGLISILRRPFKTFMLFCVLFLVNLLIIASISVYTAIGRMEDRIYDRLPSIVMLQDHIDVTFENRVQMTSELINAIGNLSYVKQFDYTFGITAGVNALDLKPWVRLPDRGLTPPGWGYHPEFGAEVKILAGVTTPSFYEVRSDFLELIEGRTFFEEEINVEEEVAPIIVSQGFAEINDLIIGSEFELAISNFYWLHGFYEIHENYQQIFIPVRIIGIFEPILSPFMELEDFVGPIFTNHRMYVPSYAVHNALDFLERSYGSVNSEVTISREPMLQMFFLHDMRMLDDFVRAVAELTDDFRVIDHTGGFGGMFSAVENLGQITTAFLFFSAGAMLVVMVLAQLLLIFERRFEFGIYLALGERRKNIVTQIVFEVIPITFLAMTCALLVGNRLAEEMSRNLIIQEIQNTPFINAPTQMEMHGYRFEMWQSDMLDMFEIHLDGATVVAYFGIGLSMTTLSIIVPVILITRLSPKKVLQ